MSTKLSQRQANIYVAIIGIFYLISGLWEFLAGLTQAESILSGRYFLLDVYRSYAVILGLVTIVVGFLLLCRINFARLTALTLAWWNLFTAPLAQIWLNIYLISTTKFLDADSEGILWIVSVVLIALMTFIRLYVIYLLRISKAGYIFLRDGQNK